MATVTRLIRTYYKYVIEDLSDPRTINWFLIGSPWAILGIIGFYLYFVYNLGPAFMKERKPYNFRKIMAVYNIMQIFLNAYIVYAAITLGWFWKFKVICEPVDYSVTPHSIKVASVVWLYHMIKIFDLLDTVFFILRKKPNQITFLHVYHHAGMVFCTWLSVRYLAGGHGTLLGLVNSFVHVVMYTHYLLTLLKVGKPWWKKYITQLQFLQFGTIFIHFLAGIMKKDCAFPKFPLAALLPQNLFMMVLFGDFYYKTYIKKKSENIDENGVPNTIELKQNGVELSNGKSKTH